MAENFDDLGEKTQNARRALEMEREKLMKQEEQLDAHLELLDIIDKLKEENMRLRETVEEYQQQLDEEKRQRSAVEMKLMEMNKLMTGMAKKSSEEAVQKVLRTYVNRSKRKTADKRAFAKSATLEIANVNGLDLPEDLKAAIESLDDEQTEPKVVTVQGNYNDVHDNNNVKMNGKED